MRLLWICACLAMVVGCSSQKVRCDKHLRPINVPAGQR